MASRVDAGGARVYLQPAIVVAVAQLVRAPDCGSGGRGFKSLQPPHFSQGFQSLEWIVPSNITGTDPLGTFWAALLLGFRSGLFLVNTSTSNAGYFYGYFLGHVVDVLLPDVEILLG